MSKPFRGVFTIPPTPFAEDGSVDVASLRRCVEFSVETGAHGIVAPVNASEFYSLADDERRLVAETVIQAADHRLPVVIGVTGLSPQHAVALAVHAEKNGADAVIAMPPFGRQASMPEIEAYYQALGAAVRIPIFIQDYGPPGTPMSPEFMARLAREIEHVDYIKEETIPPGHAVTAVLKAAGDACKGVMGGMGGRYLIDEHRRGACGAMPACHTNDILVRLWDLLEARRERQARDLFNRLLPLLNLEFIFGVAMYKEVLFRRGIIASTTMRIPARRTLDEYDHQELDAVLADMADLFTVHPPKARRKR